MTYSNCIGKGVGVSWVKHQASGRHWQTKCSGDKHWLHRLVYIELPCDRSHDGPYLSWHFICNIWITVNQSQFFLSNSFVLVSCILTNMERITNIKSKVNVFTMYIFEAVCSQFNSTPCQFCWHIHFSISLVIYIDFEINKLPQQWGWWYQYIHSIA